LGSKCPAEGYAASRWVEFMPSLISGFTMCQILKGLVKPDYFWLSFYNPIKDGLHVYTDSEKCGRGGANAVTEALGLKELCRRSRETKKAF